MKTLFLDCGMGAAGDMLTAALLELFPNPEQELEALNALGIPKVVFQLERVLKCGIAGTHVTVRVDGVEESEEMHEHHHHHHHSSLHDIGHLVEHLQLKETVRQDVLAVYRLIAEAESHVHQVPVSEIHFHEVGTLDALADITAVCYLLRKLAPQQVVASPVHVGSGQVRCAHGVLPVPAPATACLLKGIPMTGGSIQGELCTPTGAALLRHFVNSFGEMPTMRVECIGYGMGTKDFPVANCLRAMLGETEEESDLVVEISCNLDDMTAEEIGFATEQLLEKGALDVTTMPIGMKKGRPGTLLTVLCKPSEKERFVQLIFQTTSTLGVRENLMRRHILHRETVTEETPFGRVRKKLSSGYGVTRAKWEYDDLARIAKEKNLSLEAVKSMIDNG